MYMYLSHRIRRMFLSGACPQNLSPKTPLSSKDLRFLQKTGIEKNLTRTVVKQQKVLYEKHIGFLVKILGESNTQKSYNNLLKKKKDSWEKTPVYLHVCCKTQKTIKTLNSPLCCPREIFGQKGAKQSQSKFLSLNYWFMNPLQNLKPAFKKPKIMVEHPSVWSAPFRPKISLSHRQRLAISGLYTQGNPKGLKDTGFKDTAFKELLKLQAKPKEKHCKAKSCRKAQISPLPLSSPTIYPRSSSRKPLTLFVQSIKVPRKDLSLDQNNRHVTVYLQSQTLNVKKNRYRDYLRTNPGGQFLTKGNLFANSKNQYNCRYLYNRESLKTCIVPQIFRNQKPLSRAKTLLHERKKISLLYGQLTKKDLGRYSRRAVGTPGFFEDNMFTLLESRVDVCVFRAGFSKTIAAARQLIRNGSVSINGKTIYSSKSRGTPGDLFTFSFKHEIVNPYKWTTLELYNLYSSSNFLSVSKHKFLRDKNQQLFLKSKGGNIVKRGYLESKPFQRFLQFTQNEHSELSLCHCLYWGFFIYKLYEKQPLFLEINNQMLCRFFESLALRDFPVSWIYNGNKSYVYQELGCFGVVFPKKFLQSPLTKSFAVSKNAKSMITPSYNSNIKQTYSFPKKWKEINTINPDFIYNCSTSKNNRWSSAIKRHNFSGSQAQNALLAKYGIYHLQQKKNHEKHKEKKRKRELSPFVGSYSCLSKKKNKNIVFFNLYTQLLLKKLDTRIKKTRESQEGSLNPVFRKTISSSNLWATWGQKPLHLEISHKTGSFIYMYKPQKIISPVCFDWKL